MIAESLGVRLNIVTPEFMTEMLYAVMSGLGPMVPSVVIVPVTVYRTQDRVVHHLVCDASSRRGRGDGTPGHQE